MRICPRFSRNSTASSDFIMRGQPVLLLAACRTVKSDRLLVPGYQMFDTHFAYPQNDVGSDLPLIRMTVGKLDHDQDADA